MKTKMGINGDVFSRTRHRLVCVVFTPLIGIHQGLVAASS